MPFNKKDYPRVFRGFPNFPNDITIGLFSCSLSLLSFAPASGQFNEHFLQMSSLTMTSVLSIHCFLYSTLSSFQYLLISTLNGLLSLKPTQIISRLEVFCNNHLVI